MASRDEVVSVRLSSAEYRESNKLAKAETRPLSQWIRKLVVEAIAKHKAKEQ